MKPNVAVKFERVPAHLGSGVESKGGAPLTKGGGRKEGLPEPKVVYSIPKAGDMCELEIASGVKMTFCWIPKGECQLGSPKEEQDYVLSLPRRTPEARRGSLFDRGDGSANLNGMVLSLALVIAAAVAPPFAGCAWIRAENDGSGSGFVVDAGARLLVTCRHVVADRKKVDVFFPWYRGGMLVTGRGEYLRNRDLLRSTNRLVTGTVLKTADDLDLALVQVDALPEGMRAVAFGPMPGAGAPLRVVGNRLDLDSVWNLTTGPLRTCGHLSEGYFWRGKQLATAAPVLIGQLPIEVGDSGGPVFDSGGRVVGMACALRRQCPLAAVAISGTAIRAFAGVAVPTDPTAEQPELSEVLLRATVWVKPTATDLHRAGVLITRDLVLTSGRGLTAFEAVGVALPIRAGGSWVSDRGAYRDPLALQLRGAWRSGTVLATDAPRDLALIQLDSSCSGMKPVPLCAAVPKPGAVFHTMSHPDGLEFAWVYASGAVRQRGSTALAAGEHTPRVEVLVCQIPVQAGSPGGPLLNENGELVGVLSAREGAQLVGYAATSDEIRAFLDAARRDQPPKSFDGLSARAAELPQVLAGVMARTLASRGESNRAAGRIDDATREFDFALLLDPACPAARCGRARMLSPAAARGELDLAIEKGPFDRATLLFRAELAVGTGDWRSARGDLERILDVFPADADARLRLVGVYLGLGDDARAAAAIGDTLRADPKRLSAVAAELLRQADMLEKKFPDSLGPAADWLTMALASVVRGTKDATRKAALAEVLRAGGAAKTDADRLRILRAGAKTLK